MENSVLRSVQVHALTNIFAECLDYGHSFSVMIISVRLGFITELRQSYILRYGNVG